MKRISLLSMLFFGFALLSACGKKGLEADFDASKTGFLIAAADGSYYRADCLGQTGDVALNSSNASACKLNSSNARQAAGFNYTSYSVINYDFARYFCQSTFPSNIGSCYNFFGIASYQPQPTYQTCNSCVSCPFGGLCPQYCFTRCANPYPNYPQYPQYPTYPTPYPTPPAWPTWPTPTPTPNPNPTCQNLKAQARSMVSSMSFCTRDSDCISTVSFNDSCNYVMVNQAYANHPSLISTINQYNQVCRPAQPVMCPAIAFMPSCQANRCAGNNF